jgi:hypothetical protein
MLRSATAMAAAMLVGGPAFAQAYQGNPSIALGNVTIDRNAPNIDKIIVGSAQATINWSPTDGAIGGGPIDFQPAGTQVFYQNDPLLTPDFTVLNRILPLDPTRPVALNGQIVSRLFDLSSNVTPGGSVWFYSPGGVIVGSSAALDIGNLLLTANDPVTDTSGFFLSGNTFSLGQANPGALVSVLPGATITASAQNSYVAMVAPNVNQSGLVDVNGSTAYVAAEAATITINQGLFDINVTVGSDGTLSHNGETTGPASTGPGDNHRIYLVAIPKNAAVTMLIGNGSKLGFDIAGAADVVNNTVVLSAGRNVSDKTFSATQGPFGGDISIDGATFTSAVVADATRSIAAPSQTSTTQFAADATLIAEGGNILSGPISAGGSLLLLAAGAVNLASVTTGTGPTDYLYIANSIMRNALGPGSDPGPIFGMQPLRTNGPIVFSAGSTIATGNFRASTQDFLVMQGDVAVANDMLLDGRNLIATGNVTVGGNLFANAFGFLGFTGTTLIGGDGNFQAQAPLPPNAAGGGGSGTVSLRTGNVTVGGNVDFFVQAGDIIVGDIIAGGELSIDGDPDLTAGGAVTAGNLLGGGNVSVNAATDLIVGNVISTATAADLIDDAFGIGIDAGGNLTIASATAQASIGMRSRGGDLSIGAVNAIDGDYLALSGNGISIGSILTSSTGTTFLANASMLVDPVPDGFTPDMLFTMTPVRTGGAVTINGPISTGRFSAASGGAFTAQTSLAAQSAIAIDAGAAAIFNGPVTAGTIKIASGDIQISAAGFIGDNATTALNLISNNAAGTTIGGTAAVTGYGLDAAEAQRLRAAAIAIDASATDVVIRDLALGGGNLATGNLVGANGSLRIGTPGSIRITGDVTFSGMAKANALRLSAGGRVELATDTGRIALFDTGTTLGGILDISAAHVHVGTSALLSQLATDPRFQGRDAILAQAAASPLDTGYLQADRIQLAASNTLLIQNSGTATLFAGFTAGSGGLQLTSNAPAGTPLDMNIYGRIATASGGFVTNDAVVGAASITQSSVGGGFTSGSRINGCQIALSSCQPDPAAAISGTISAAVQAVTIPPPDPQGLVTPDETRTPAGEESEAAPVEEAAAVEEEAPAKEAKKASANRGPIARPVTLINMRPMNSSATIDEPVSSGGNPSLIDQPASDGGASE